MAKIVLQNYVTKSKTRRPGVHSKNASKGQTGYKKQYRGQKHRPRKKLFEYVTFERNSNGFGLLAPRRSFSTKASTPKTISRPIFVLNLFSAFPQPLTSNMYALA